ncbi:hypothetical protein GCM10023231_18920 [Olivibacter ginsenosidimutans]|uniref:Lipoprotein n=1 Tax=Olivibacter ginsenosidimutans TaxID=1176537 RepID=A0ABP9B6R0_9SPHI
MKRSRCFLSIAICLFLVSCFGDEFESKKILGNYYLTTTDGFQNNIYIDFKLETGNFVGVVPSCVFSVGCSKKYIIAKQHPFSYPANIDSSLTNYYILHVHKKTLVPDSGVLGPLNLKEFQFKKKELRIEDVEFSMTIR